MLYQITFVSEGKWPGYSLEGNSKSIILVLFTYHQQRKGKNKSQFLFKRMEKMYFLKILSRKISLIWDIKKIGF